jgi:anti-sigma factor RsiW
MMLNRPRRAKPVVCRDVVELVTAYLDDALTTAEREAVDRHLEACADCTRILGQWRTVIAMTGRLAEADVARLDEATRAELLAAFRAGPD